MDYKKNPLRKFMQIEIHEMRCAPSLWAWPFLFFDPMLTLFLNFIHLSFPHLFPPPPSLLGRVVSIQVDPSCSVKDAKEKIKDKEGVPVDQQQLIFSGRTLENDRPLNSYNIQKDSTVHLVIKLNQSEPSGPPPARAGTGSYTTQLPPPTRSQSSSSRQNWSSEVPRVSSSRVTVVTPSGKEVKLDAIDVSKTTVLDLKRMISSKERVPPDHQVLLYDNTQLQNSHFLSFYGLGSGCIVHLSFTSSSKMSLYVKTLSGETYMLSPFIYQTVGDIKNELRVRHQVNVNNQKLVFHGVLLEESSMLYECDLPNQCTMHIIKDPNAPHLRDPSPPPLSRQYQQQAPIPILFRTLRGDIVTLLTYPSERVRDVKKRLQEREGFPRGQMNLVLGGTELRDDAFLEEYRLQQDSTLLVTFKIPTGLDLFAVDMTNDEMLPIEGLKVDDHVEHLEAEIRQAFRISRSTELTLILKYEVLSPQFLLSHYTIPKNAVIQVYRHEGLQRRSEGRKTSIIVSTVTGIKCYCELYLSRSTVSDLKIMIQDRVGLPKKDQVLLKRGEVLEEYMNLSEALRNKTGEEEEEEEKYKVMLFTKVSTTKSITVSLPNGNSTTLRMQSHQSIKDLKMSLSDRTVQPEQQVLRYRGRVLEDHYCIGDYLLPEGSRLTCTSLSSANVYEFVVHGRGGRVRRLSLDCQCTLRILKLLVSQEFSIPLEELRLFFCGDLLFNEKRLDQYGFPTPCTLWAE